MFERIVSYICITLFLVSSIFLSSCSFGQIKMPNAVTGKWEHGGHIFEYRDNGNLLYDGELMRYEVIDDDTIRIARNDGTDREYTFDYKFNPDGTLSINKVKYFPVI